MRFIFFVKFFIVAATIYGQNQDSVKCWRESDKLTWADFGSVPPNEYSTTLTKAISPTKILVRHFTTLGVLSYKVTPIFLINKAWKKDTSKTLLEHEQLHFDLAELYARKLRREIASILSTIKEPKSKDYKYSVESLLLEFSEIQIRYDFETLNGLDLEAQKKWKEKVSKEIFELKIYASKDTDCF